jgi:hypothetical protein
MGTGQNKTIKSVYASRTGILTLFVIFFGPGTAILASPEGCSLGQNHQSVRAIFSNGGIPD